MPHEKGQGAASSFGNNLNHSWLGAVKLAVAICIAYFLAAWLGLAFQAEGVAVFWPAAGIAIGALLTLRPSTRLPVSVGVISATVAANFMFGRNIWLATAFGFVNAGEALLTAWLIGHWFGSAFKLDDVRQVLGFMVVSAVGAAIGAIGGAAAVSLVVPTASPLNVWRVWFAADLLGIVTTAPLVIGLGEAARVPPPRRELIEGGIGLTTLALLSAFVIFLPKGPWESAIPVALVFPVLLWVAVRCRPVFAAAAAFIVALAIIWSVASNVGHFGDAGIPWTNRILVAQTHGMAGALLALVLTALFAERRRSEAALKCSGAALKQGKERLQLALDGAELGAFSADFVTRRFECDARAAQILGHDVPPRTIKESRRFIHPDDLARIDDIYAEAQRTNEVCKYEYRVQPPPNRLHGGETRWVAAEGSIVRDPQGAPLGLLGVTRDITERKKAEAALRESETRLAGQRRALELALNGEPLAISLGVLVRTAIDQLGEGVRAAFYLANPAHTGLHHVVGMCAEYAAAVDDFEIGPASLSCGLATHTGQPILTPDVAKEPRWAPLLWLAEKFDFRGCWSFPIRTEAGRFVGTLAIYWRRPREATPRELELAAVLTATAAIIIARHTAQAALRESEERLRESNAQLALAGKAGLVGSYVYEADLEQMKVSEGYAAMHGLPEGTSEATRSEWRTRVHPDDLARLEELCTRSFSDRRSEFNADYRIVRASGEIRWIESRSFISYDREGAVLRIIGVNIDVTQRKNAEESLAKERTMLARLHGVSSRLWVRHDLHQALDEILAGAIELLGADMGAIRSFDKAQGVLKIGAHRGFKQEFLDFFREVSAADDSACGRVLRSGKRMVIEDVEADTLYAPFHTIARAAGYRAVQSTPIISREGTLLGTLATHFRSVHRPTEQDLRLLDLYVRQAADIIEHHRDITQRKELEDHKSTLISELDHRVKNVLALVSAVALRTQETSSSMADFVAALNGRIKSMATTHELLSYSRWRGIPLADLVRNELAPYATADNTLIDGPDVELRPELGQTLAMVFHELATNAAKFGAISVRTGRVSVRWKFIRNGHAKSWLSIQWEESGGPNVVPPTRTGYGTSVVLELIPYEFGGSVDLTHNPEGVRCRLEFPAHWLITRNPREELSKDRPSISS